VGTLADFDFGITGLSQQFHQDWPSLGTPAGIASEYVNAQSASHLSALADDASFMLDWNSRGDYAGSLWAASTMGYYQDRLAGMSCEDLLRHVLGECNKRLDRTVVRSQLAPTLSYEECASDVRRAVQHLHACLANCLPRAGLEARREGSPTAVEALYQYADPAARPELAFRFLLRLLVASSCARFVELWRIPGICRGVLG
jgi:hypothetical protein